MNENENKPSAPESAEVVKKARDIKPKQTAQKKPDPKPAPVEEKEPEELPSPAPHAQKSAVDDFLETFGWNN